MIFLHREMLVFALLIMHYSNLQTPGRIPGCTASSLARNLESSSELLENSSTTKKLTKVRCLVLFLFGDEHTYVSYIRVMASLRLL